MAAASSGSRFDILPMAGGECLCLRSDGRLSGPCARAPRAFSPPSMTGGRRCGLPETESLLPFSGGWLLYLGYELATEIEPRLRLAAKPRSGGRTGDPRAGGLDSRSRDRPGLAHGRIRLRRAARRVRRSVRGLRQGTAGDRLRVRHRRGRPGDLSRRRAPRSRVHRRRRRVSDQSVARLAGRATPPVDPVRVYQRLRASNPSPFAALLRHEDFALLSSSPERLVSIRGNTVSTRPIAGTRPRGATPEADAALVRSLLDNEKERAEHVMLIDLERNDLGQGVRRRVRCGWMST